MCLKNSLYKVNDVIEHIIYSNRDVSVLRSRKHEVYTHVGGKTAIQLETDMGPRMIPTLSSTDTSIATIDKEGYVYGHSNGTATVTIECASLSVSATVHVGDEIRDTTNLPAQDRVIDEIEIINPRSSLEVGDEYALYAVGISNTLSPKYDIAYYNPIKFSSSDPTVAGITFGTLCAYKPGTCTITATDLNNNASASFTLNVVSQYVPLVTDAETYIPSIDNTGATDVTVSIATALDYASDNGYKKISFPKGTYKMNGDNRPNASPIDFPSNMIVDFNGSDIIFDPSATIATTGYTMFQINGKSNLWLVNARFVGENYSLTTLIRKEADTTLMISGQSKNIHIENCSFNWSPGFNARLSYAREHIYGFHPNSVRAGSVVAGGLGNNGEDVTAPSGTWRAQDYKECRCTSGGWTLGNWQGEQTAYLRSRLYDIAFYDNDKNFLFIKRNCYTYQRYEFPTGIDPKWCRIAFFQTNEPDGYERDWYSYIMIADILSPEDVYFKNCEFKNNISTGLSPQGGTHVVVEGCTFVDNGHQDPYSHIDWENGKQNSQGHIVKDCNFSREALTFWACCAIINGYCRNVTFHDNYVLNGSFSAGSESTMQRCFNNIFKGYSVSVGGKCDSIFAGNQSTQIPTITNGLEGTYTINVDNEIIT